MMMRMRTMKNESINLTSEDHTKISLLLSFICYHHVRMSKIIVIFNL